MKEPLSPELQDLHAYVDRQLPPHARQRVDAWLDANPAEKRRAEDYAALREGLRALYDPALSDPIPKRLRRRPRQWLRPLGALAASLFLLLSGIGIGMRVEHAVRVPVAEVPSVAREAAMAYAVYTPEVRHPVEVPGDQEPHLVAWLTKRMGAPVRAPRLDKLGFVLVGGRLLSSDDGPGALLMYENPEGRRVVLYACRHAGQERATAFRFTQEEGIAVFHWVEGSLSYALAGEIDRAGLLALAESVYQQIAM